MNHITEALVIIGGLLAGFAIFYAFYRLDRREKDNAYWRAVATEQARRIEAGRVLYEQAARNRED
jgi:NhaP-type Na+/H+ or K+/H+ antiporter